MPCNRLVLWTGLCILVSSCSASRQEEARTPTKTPADSPQLASTRECEVSLPNGSAPPGGEAGEQFYGNGKIWAVLWPNGIIAPTRDYVRPDGSIGMKIPWWANGTKGELRIFGRRLDRPGRPLRVLGINAGWPRKDQHGTRFWASGLIFPTEGCWEVTGRVGTDELIFVTVVVKPA